MRFLARVLLAVVVAGSTLAGVVVAPADAAGSTEEQQFLALTNQARAAAGLPALQDDQATANIARSWSQYMASTGVLQHDPYLVSAINSQITTQWRRIGENVGFGSDVGSLQTAFMNSAPHRANVLGDYNRVGIGAARDGTGRLWVTLDFINGPPVANNPFGSLDSVRRVPAGLQVIGWAADADAPTQSLAVDVYVDGNGYSMGVASAPRTDVGALLPGYGTAHGYGGFVPAAPGWHRICAYGINVGSGSNTAVGCQTVFVESSPFGSIDSIRRVPGGLQVGGWAGDPDTSSPITAVVYVDGNGYSLGVASAPRTDVGALLPGYGTAHGYTGFVPATAGSHQVCAYGLNVGSGANHLLACRSVFVDASPFGTLDWARPTSSGITMSGWAIDPDTSAPITVVVYIDGAGFVLGTANLSRPDVGSAYVGYGAAHGYQRTMSVGHGTHSVCTYGLNVGAGNNNLLGCQTVSN